MGIYNTKFLLVAIVLIALLLRVIAINQVPPGLNRDEAAIGYTAYSILKTGRDEYGTFLPLSIKSFGDWKLPFYIYATIPFIAIFGLTDLSVRLPSVLFGVGTVVTTFFLGFLFFQNMKKALVCALLVAISPWGIFFSRVASEANLAVFLLSSGLIFLLVRKNHLLFYIGILLIALTLITYHANHIFTPLLFITLIIQFPEKFKGKVGKSGIIIFFAFSFFIFAQTLFSADRTKLSGLFSLNDVSLVYEKIVSNRLIYQDPFFGKLLNNKAVFFIETTVKNYLKSFSPEFLFFQGGTNNQHNIPDFGNLYLIEAPFLLFGVYFLFKKNEKYRFLLITWLLLSAVAPAITKDAPHSARQFVIFPAISLVIGYGLVTSSRMINRKILKYFFTLLVAGGFLANSLLFVSRYFIVFPYKQYSVWGDGFKEMVAKIVRLQSLYDKVIIARPDYSPYIYYLFYTKADPEDVQKNLVHYSETREGFSHVKAYKNIEFRKIDWPNDLHVPNSLYVDWVEGVPSGATQSAILLTSEEIIKYNNIKTKKDSSKFSIYVTSHLIDEVKLPDKTPLFYFIKTEIAPPNSL